MANVLFSHDKLRKVVDYVGATQPKLEKMAQAEQALRGRIPAVVDSLVKSGLLSPHLKEAKVRAFEANPVEILNTLEQTASMVTVKPIGSGDGKSAEKAPSANQVFVDRLMNR